MISFEEAYREAQAVKTKIDFCTEYENGYLFGTDLDEIEYGGANASAIVLKEDGRVVDMPTFMMILNPGKELGRIPLPE